MRWMVGILSALLMWFPQTSAKGHKAKNGNWIYVDHDLSGTRYSPLSQINSTNAMQLAKACSYSFPEKVASQTAPIVDRGIMYVTTAHYTVALNGFDCQVIWTYKWTPRDFEPAATHKGAAIADGRIIRGTEDDFLIALDARNGQLLWSKQIANPHQGCWISMPPLVHNGLIYIGPAGAETACNGWVGAFKLSNGDLVWKFNIIPADGEPGAETWGPNPAARKHGGGNLWTPLSYDNQRNLLYVPGGNPAPDFYDDDRPGANLYTNSIIALDGQTGRLQWYKQFTPHDVHDLDLSHVSPIFNANVNGVQRTVIATTSKDGMLRALDRDTHEILYSVPYTTRLNAEAPISTTPTRICPGTFGGQEWNGSAYSFRLNLLVVPTNDWCTLEWKNKQPPGTDFEHSHDLFLGGDQKFDPWTEARGWITAFDASTGKTLWRNQTPKPMVAGVTVTAGDVVFTGELTGDVVALDARTGKDLWRHNIGDPIGGGVMTYEANGVQHLAVVSGYVGLINLFAPIGGGNTTVTIFRLEQK